MFTPPSAEDAEAATDVVASLHSIDGVRRALGEPDETYTPDDFPKMGYDAMPFKQQWIYRQRFATLEITVIERLDGSVMFLFGGKFRGASKEDHD